MRRELAVLLSGIGFYKLSARRRKLMRYVLGVSLAAHVLAMIIFGSWIISRHFRGEKTTFVAQPPPRTYEPRKLEHRVKVQKRQRSSSRPSMMPRMVAMKTAAFALPEIKVDPKLIHTTFQPKFKAVSGTGLGVGLGTGYGADGFGEGVSSYDFFGIQTKGEKIAILVDVSISMIEDEKGGVAGYEAVKARLGQVVDSLSDAAMFNVFVFADAASAMDKQLVIANADNKTRAKLYIRPFNTPGNLGLTTGNIRASSIGLQAHGGTTRLDLPLTAAFEQGADTILVISDGIPKVKKGWTSDQMRAFAEERQQWQAQNAARVQAWDGARAAAEGTAEKVWIPPTPAVPPKQGGVKEGESNTGQPARPGHWQVVYPRNLGHRPEPPPMPDPGFWTLVDFIEHLRMLYENYYVKKGQKPPVIHCIGYQIDKEGDAFLHGLSKHYKGKYRRVAKIR